MKRILLTILVLIYFSSFSFAQSAKEKNYKWGCAVAINSIQAQIGIPLIKGSGSLSTGSGAIAVDADANILAKGSRHDNSFSWSIIPRYRFSKDIILRFEFSITHLGLKANFNSVGSSGSLITSTVANEKVTTKLYKFSPGLQWFFVKKWKIESYCGGSVHYVNYGDLNIEVYSEVKQDTIVSWNSIEENTNGGFATGIGSFAGFSFYLSERISLGTELSVSAMYYKLGGETQAKTTQQVTPNPIEVFSGTYSNSYVGFKISKVTASFNISILF